MAYQALYRKYRPQTFSDVIGQEHITETLKNELIEGKIVHAYLFTGTRGTGKTSCAKILAKAVNCLSPKDGDPCGECDMCHAVANGEVTDIEELDAASNNGVEYIRDLREKATFAPASGKYRVYIIDEVHMLSSGAFNALLKTLEEPPEYVIFILATTEVQKLPATILSRCQRFDFRRIDSEKISERLKYIANKEGIALSDSAATLIASVADGGMRDAISILDVCASVSREIDEDIVATACAMAGSEYLVKMADCIRNGDTESALLLVDELHNSSVDMLRLLGELIEHYRNLMILKTVKSANKPIVCSASRLKILEKQAEEYTLPQIMAVLSVLQSATVNMASGNRRCEMEMALIKLCSPKTASDINSLELRIAALENGSVKSVPKNTPVDEKVPEVVNEEIPLPEAPTDNENTAPVDENGESPIEQWDDIIALLRKDCPLMAGVLKDSKAYIRNGYLLIDAQSSQFRSLVNGKNPVYKNAIRTAANQILGETYKLGPYKKPAKSDDDPLAEFAQKLKELEIK